MIDLSLRCCELNSHQSSTSDLSELIHVLKAVSIVTRGQLNLSMMFVDSHFLIAKVSPEWRLNPALTTQKRCPFPWIEVSCQQK